MSYLTRAGVNEMTPAQDTDTQEKTKLEPCIICNKPTKLFCGECYEGEDEYKQYYCDEHYMSVVLTGNCCYGSERLYGNV
jgi:hypothetical protein